MPKSTSPWMQMRTIKNLKTSLEILQLLNLQRTSTPTSSSTSSKLSKDQLQVQYLIMKTVSIAMNVVHKVRIPKGPCTTEISTF